MMPEADSAGCPSLMDLEAFATGQSADESLSRHLARCSRCRARVEEVRSNNELMARLVGAGLRPEDARRQGGSGPALQVPLLAEDIDGYEIHDEIRRGGQGAVYRATQRATNRMVALKVLLSGALASPSQQRRFEREIELVAQLQHPNIVTVHDSGRTSSGCHYFAMEYIEGVRLDEYVRAERPRYPGGDRAVVRSILKLFSRVCAGISYAHQRGVIHRDLKPGNILVDGEGEPHILDFGLAKALEADPTQTGLTVSQDFLGTPAYASPEQAQGTPSLIDTRTDIYSLGVMLYEALTGHFPYPVFGGMPEVLRNIAEAKPQRPSAWLRQDRQAEGRAESVASACSVDGELETLVLKALAKEQEHRYQSAAELRQDLERYLAGEPISARPPSTMYHLRKFAQRNRVLVAGVAAVFVALVLGVVGTSIGMARAWKAEGLARQRGLEALEARDAEAAGRLRVEAEVAKARSVNEFLIRMLTAASPELGAGADVKVTDVLDDAARELDGGSLAEQPKVEAAARNALALTYLALGLYLQAEPQLQRALEICRADQEAHGPILATTLFNTANVRRAQGDFAAAEDLHRQALALRRRLLGDEHRETLMSMNDLATVCSAQGRYDAAAELLEETVQLQRRALGPEHAHTLITTANLAGLRQRQGRLDEAAALFAEVLEPQRRVLGAEHPSTLTTMHNLAALHRSRGRYVEAEKLFLRVLEVRRRVLGEDHAGTLTVTNNLANLYAGQGRYGEAEELLVEVLEGQRRLFGEEHPHTLTTMQNLADVFAGQGRYAEAEPLYVRALEGSRRALGAEHPNTLRLMNNLAALFGRMDRLEEAETLLREVLEVGGRTLGENHPNILGLMASLAGVCGQQGRYEEAGQLLIRATDGLKATVGEEHPATLVAVSRLAVLYHHTDRLEEAGRLFDQVLEVRTRVLGPEHPDTLAAMSDLAALLHEQGRPGEARPLLTEAWAGRRRALGADHPDALATCYRLAQVCRDLGDLETAETHAVQYRDGCRSRFGPDSDEAIRAAALLEELGKALGQPEEAPESGSRPGRTETGWPETQSSTSGR